jgi:hypothetical protein
MGSGFKTQPKLHLAGMLAERHGKKSKCPGATLDTMDFQFSWEIFEFGEKSGSYLNDVAIISENIIWAVGEIYTEDSYTYDSLGNWIQPTTPCTGMATRGN